MTSFWMRGNLVHALDSAIAEKTLPSFTRGRYDVGVCGREPISSFGVLDPIAQTVDRLKALSGEIIGRAIAAQKPLRTRRMRKWQVQAPVLDLAGPFSSTV
jgi:hypothetical protein